MEKQFTFTIEDIEKMVKHSFYLSDNSDFIFNWNFEIDKPQSINKFPVLTVIQKKSK